MTFSLCLTEFLSYEEFDEALLRTEQNQSYITNHIDIYKASDKFAHNNSLQESMHLGKGLINKKSICIICFNFLGV